MSITINGHELNTNTGTCYKTLQRVPDLIADLNKLVSTNSGANTDNDFTLAEAQKTFSITPDNFLRSLFFDFDPSFFTASQPTALNLSTVQFNDLSVFLEASFSITHQPKLEGCPKQASEQSDSSSPPVTDPISQWYNTYFCDESNKCTGTDCTVAQDELYEFKGPYWLWSFPKIWNIRQQLLGHPVTDTTKNPPDLNCQ